MAGRALVLALCAVSGVVSAGSGDRPAPTRVDVADGVYLFTTPGYGDVGLDGSSVAIVSRQGVLVFDSNGTPAAAAAALAPAFKTQLVQWYLHRVYDELNGTLSDAIAAIPKG